MRFQTKRVLSALGGIAVVLLLAGCGSSGGGGNGNNTSTGTLGVYVADAFNNNFSQVWMTLYRIELSNNGASYQTVYDNTGGTPMNLAALSGVAQLLGNSNVPAGNYTQARLTVGDHMMLVPAGGGASTSTAVDTSGGTAANGKFTFTTFLSVTVTPGQVSNMAVDFNLPGFQMVGNAVHMSVMGMDMSRFGSMPKRGDLEGTVSNLVAGTSFDLVMGGVGMMGGGMMGTMMAPISVRLTSATTIFDESTGAAGTLANGQRVEVLGTPDPNTRTVTATSIRIEDAASQAGAGNFVSAQGAIATINTGGLSFTLAPSWASNFVPAGGTLTVQTDSNTVFGGMMGGMMGGGSFASLSVGQSVMVSGVYNSATGVLVARRVMAMQ